MKRAALLLLATLLSGCAHQEFLCGNALFIFIEGDAQEFVVNFRDERLLKSDVILSGSAQQWVPGSKWKADPYFSISAALDVKTKLPAVELAVEHGTAGAPLYSRAVIFSASDFSGRVDIPRFEFGGSQLNGRLVLSFRQSDDWKRIEVEMAALLTKRPNQALQPTRMLGTSAAEQPLVPSTRVADL